MDVNDVVAVRSAGQSANLVGNLGQKGDHLAPAQEPAELDLLRRPADLSNHRCGGQRHDPALKTSPVVRP